MDKMFLYLTVGPSGLDDTHILLSEEDRDPFSFTGGEGQCLKFELVERDCSTKFNEALENGTVMKSIGKIYHAVRIVRSEVE